MRVNRHIALIATLAACHRGTVAPAASAFSLTVLNADGSVPSVATVTLQDDLKRTTYPVTRSASGAYSAAIPSGAARVSVEIATPEHVPVRTKLWLPTTGPADFTLQLRAVVRRKNVISARVIGDFNKFNTDSGVKLVADGAGKLRAAVPFTGDSCRFQILGIGGGGRGPWMPVSSYALVPDPFAAPAYAGVIKPVRDTLFFVVDTSGPRGLTAPPRLTMRGGDSLALRANQLLLARADAWTSNEAVNWWRDSGSTKYRDEITNHAIAMLDSVTDHRVRGEALVTALALGSRGPVTIPRFGAMILREIPPGSPLVNDRDGLEAVSSAIMAEAMDSTLSDSARARVNETIVRNVQAYLLPVVRVHGDSIVRINGWLSAAYLLQPTKDTSAIYSLIDEAMAALPNNEFVRKLPNSMGRAKVLAEGKRFPTFRMTPIGGTGELTNAVFAKARFTLVDFWGIWCAPCVWEMPVLHKAHETFAAKGFTILSLSTDPEIALVDKFRKEKYPMPWTHGWFGPEGNSSPALEAMGVMEFPLAVLVDSTGTIVKVRDGLRGAQLEKTLAGLLTP